MKKRILAVLLSLAMVVSLLPQAVFAEEDFVASVTYGDTTVNCATWDDVKAETWKADGDYTIKLLSDSWADNAMTPTKNYSTLTFGFKYSEYDWMFKIKEGEVAVTIDLNGFTLWGGETNSVIQLGSTGTFGNYSLTIDDTSASKNGKIVHTFKSENGGDVTNKTAVILAYGGNNTINIKNGTIEAACTNAGDNEYNAVKDWGNGGGTATVNMSGGKLVTKSGTGYGILQCDVKMTGGEIDAFYGGINVWSGGNTLNIEDGTIKSQNYYVALVYPSGTITGGTFETAYTGLIYNTGTLDISGGTFQNNNTGSPARIIQNYSGLGKVYISGNPTFSGAGDVMFYNDGATIDIDSGTFDFKGTAGIVYKGNVDISGGDFTTTAYSLYGTTANLSGGIYRGVYASPNNGINTLTLPEGKKVVELGTNTWTIGEEARTINVNSTETLQQALDSAKKGDTIVVAAGDYETVYLRNVGEDANRIMENVTIKAADDATVNIVQIASSATAAKALDIENLTIDGLTFSDPAHTGVLCTVNSGNLRVNGLTVQNCTKVGNNDSSSVLNDHKSFVGLCYDHECVMDALYAGDNSLTCGYYDVKILNNDITNVYQPIMFPNSGPMVGLTVSGNTFTGCMDNHMMLSTKTAGEVVISDNTLVSMTGRFARISGATADATFTISNNTVTTPLGYDTGGDGDIFKITGTAGFTVTDTDNDWTPGDYTNDAHTTWIALGDTELLNPEVSIEKNGQETIYMSLAKFRDSVNEGNNYQGYTVTLLKDIDLKNENWTPIGSTSGKAFEGSFDGGNHTISNLKVDTTSSGAGLFGYVAFSEISHIFKNITLTNVDVKGASNVGGLVGWITGTAVFENININGIIKIEGTGADIGGVVGHSTGVVNIDSCKVLATEGSESYIKGSTTSAAACGGVIGFDAGDAGKDGTIKNCKVSNLTLTSYNRIGGIVGMRQHPDGYKDKYEGYINDNNVENVTINVYGPTSSTLKGRHDAQAGLIVGTITTNGTRHNTHLSNNTYSGDCSLNAVNTKASDIIPTALYGLWTLGAQRVKDIGQTASSWYGTNGNAIITYASEEETGEVLFDGTYYTTFLSAYNTDGIGGEGSSEDHPFKLMTDVGYSLVVGDKIYVEDDGHIFYPRTDVDGYRVKTTVISDEVTLYEIETDPAATFVASMTVGDKVTYFTTIYKAFVAAPKDNTPCTITVLDDCVLTPNYTIPVGCDITLELNGKTVEMKDNAKLAMFYVQGKLTVQDNTDVNADGTGTGKLWSHSDTVAMYGLATQNGTINFNSGLLLVESGSTTLTEQIQALYIGGNRNGIINANGGKVKAVVNNTANQSAYTFYGSGNSTAGAEFTLNGSVFEGNSAKSYLIGDNTPYGNTTLKLVKGTLISPNKNVDNYGDKKVSDGKFVGCPITDILDADSVIEKPNDYTRIIRPVTYVAQIGDDKYETLAEAFDAAKAGDTIEVLAETEETVDLTAFSKENELMYFFNPEFVEGKAEDAATKAAASGVVFVKDTNNVFADTYSYECELRTYNSEGTANQKLTTTKTIFYGDMETLADLYAKDNTTYDIDPKIAGNGHGGSLISLITEDIVDGTRNYSVLLPNRNILNEEGVMTVEEDMILSTYSGTGGRIDFRLMDEEAFTLDLNGHEIYQVSGDNGTGIAITSDGAAALRLSSFTNMTIVDSEGTGSVVGSLSAVDYYGDYSKGDGGVLTLESGTLIGRMVPALSRGNDDDNTTSYQDNNEKGCVIRMDDTKCTFIMNGGTLDTDRNEYRRQSETKLWKTAAAIQVTQVCENATITLNGGRIERTPLDQQAPTNGETEYPEIIYRDNNATVTKTVSDDVEIYGVARIGGTIYETLQDAVTAAEDGDTIVLLVDITVDQAIEDLEGKTFTIDLNDTTLSTRIDDAFTLNNTNLTVINGTIDHNIASGSAWEPFFLKGTDEGSLTLKGVDITSPMYSVYVSASSKNKTLVVEDCNFVSTGDGVIYASGADTTNEVNIKDSTLSNSNTKTAAIQLAAKATLEDVVITSTTATALVCYENTDLLIKGEDTSFIAKMGAISTNGSKDLEQITIEDGYFETTGTSHEEGIAFYHPDGSPLTIKGGTFKGATALYIKGGEIDIQGGTFIGTGAYEAAQKVHSGAHATGDAVVVEASGYLASETYNPDPNPSVTISGGFFQSTNGEPIAYYTFDDNKEAHDGKMVSGGYFNKEISEDIVAPGYECIDTPENDPNHDEYPYMIGSKIVIPTEEGDINVKVDSKTDQKEATVSEDIKGEDEKKVAEDIIGKINGSATGENKSKVVDLSQTVGNYINALNMEKLHEIATEKNKDTELTTLVDNAKQAVEGGKNVEVTMHVTTDVDVEVTGVTVEKVDETTTVTRFALDITPFYTLTVKSVMTEEDKEPVEEVVQIITQDMKEELEVPEKTIVSFPAPDGFTMNDGDTLYVIHTKESGDKFLYPATFDQTTGMVSFENPDGFSEFELIKSSSENSVAMNLQTGVEYETLQAAVNAATNGQTIVLLKDLLNRSAQIEAQVVDKDLTIDLNGHKISGNYTNGGAINTYGNSSSTTSHLIITDNSETKGGSIENTYTGSTGCGIYQDGYSVVTVTNVSVKGAYAGVIQNNYWAPGNELTVGNDASVIGTSYAGVNISSGNSGSSVIVDGGTISGGARGVQLGNIGASLTVNSGSITGNNWGVYVSKNNCNIEINGGTVSGGEDGIYIGGKNNSVTVNDGLVTGADYGIYVDKVTSGTGNSVTVTGGSVRATANDADAAIGLWDSAKLTMTGGVVEAIGTDSFAIANNGNNTKATTIDISGGTVSAVGEASTAIYQAGPSTTTISGTATITGHDAAIEIRNGSLNVSGGTLTATAETFSCDPNGNGTTTVGAALAIAQHVTKQDIDVTISGGTFKGLVPVNECNPQENDPAPQVAMDVTAGKFYSTATENPQVMSCVDCDKFTSGGFFTHELDQKYIAPGYICISTPDGDERTEGYLYMIGKLPVYTNASLTLNEAFTMDFYAEVEEVVYNAIDDDLVFVSEIYCEGDPSDVRIIPVESIDDSEEGKVTMTFNFDGIDPSWMAENINAKLYLAEEDGKGGYTYVTELIDEVNITVAKYCNLAYSMAGEDEALKTLLADILDYGKAAQFFHNHKTSELCTCQNIDGTYSDEDLAWITDNKTSNTAQSSDNAYKKVYGSNTNGLVIKDLNPSVVDIQSYTAMFGKGGYIISRINVIAPEGNVQNGDIRIKYTRDGVSKYEYLSADNTQMIGDVLTYYFDFAGDNLYKFFPQTFGESFKVDVQIKTSEGKWRTWCQLTQSMNSYCYYWETLSPTGERETLMKDLANAVYRYGLSTARYAGK